MRLLTFSVLKNCKLKAICCQLPRTFSTETVKPKVDPAKSAEGDPQMVEFEASWAADEEAALRERVRGDLRVLPGFVSEAEEAALLAELEPTLKRMRYEFDHWDNAIHGFRETERSAWLPHNAAVLERVHRVAFAPGDVPLPHAHVLDLAPAGHIKPHVDAVRFCGDVIAGLCLAADAVMRLQHAARAPLALRALLPRRALYVMRGVARYEFTHAVLGHDASAWRGQPLRKGRRVAVICRSAPPAPPAPPH